MFIERVPLIYDIWSDWPSKKKMDTQPTSSSKRT
jgi:hypothetical protein